MPVSAPRHEADLRVEAIPDLRIPAAGLPEVVGEVVVDPARGVRSRVSRRIGARYEREQLRVTRDLNARVEAIGAIEVVASGRRAGSLSIDEHAAERRSSRLA